MREIQRDTSTSKEAQSKRWYCLFAQVYQMPERVKSYISDITCTFGTQ